MITYRIRGQVLKDEKNEKLIPEAEKNEKLIPEVVPLRVEAWDKDEHFDDRLDSSKTDLGFFDIEFTDEDFNQDTEERDWIPDVFFVVYRGKDLVGSTVEADIPGIVWKYFLVVSQQSPFLPSLPLKLNGQETKYSIKIQAAGIVPETPTQPKPLNGFQVYNDNVVDILPTIENVNSLAASRNSALVTVDNSGGSLQQIVDNALGQVLCRSSKNDPKAFLDSLTKTFTPQESNGRITYNWTPCSYNTVQTELGGTVSGAQASLFHRAKTLLDDALRQLDKLYALNPAADPQNMEAVRSVVRTQIVELINELGTQGGPRTQRVDSLFQLLVGDAEENDSFDKIGGQLKDLAEIFGLTRSRVNNVDEEQNFSNYLIIKDSLLSIRDSWNAFNADTGGGAYIGTQLVLLSQALSVVAESVQETYRIMDSVFLGPAERQAVWIDFAKARQNPPNRDRKSAFPLPDGTQYTIEETKQLKPAMTIEKLLSWTLNWSTKEAPTIAIAGGKLGIAKSIVETSNRLMILMQAASFVRVPNTAFQRAGVVRALRDLAFQLYEVKRLAVELIPPLTGEKMPDADDVKDLLQDIRDLLKNPQRQAFIRQIINRNS
ncbi:MAG: hypothetical protein KME31_10960 [Tolypothrix carrinoi HA7290-LM1]|jgi:hypothetical protein|nr:hypothetical protein [Tolypothrix carrinoi HA7290-LM1]